MSSTGGSQIELWNKILVSKVYNGFVRLISAIFFSISVGIFTFNDVYANSFETDPSAAEKFLMGCIVKCIKNPVNLEFFMLEGSGVCRII